MSTLAIVDTDELYQQPLSEIPIRKIQRYEPKTFVDLIDRILVAKERDPKADTTALEREIDQPYEDQLRFRN